MLIQVKACGLTRPAYNAFREVSPSSDNMKTRLPVGCEVSGIIQSCGTEVTTLRPGDTVVGIIPMDYGQSGCSEYVVLNEYDVGRLYFIFIKYIYFLLIFYNKLNALIS